jgi:hypothetical protein
MLLFGPASMEVDIEDGWESIRPLEMEPLKVVQALLTSGGGGWFATVIRPRLATAKGTVDGEPRQGPEPSGAESSCSWSASMDEEGRPVVMLMRNGEQSSFRMPEPRDRTE